MPSGVTLMLAGFRSRWTIPFSCAASSASVIWWTMSQRLVERKRPVLEALGEGRPFDQFHDERAIFHAVDRGDVGMVQRRQHLRLAREARQAVGVLAKSSGQL